MPVPCAVHCTALYLLGGLPLGLLCPHGFRLLDVPLPLEQGYQLSLPFLLLDPLQDLLVHRHETPGGSELEKFIVRSNLVLAFGTNSFHGLHENL